MIQNRKTAENRTQPGGSGRREVSNDSAFKPVALPALAAAVQAVRAKPERQAPRQIPAILRKDAQGG